MNLTPKQQEALNIDKHICVTAGAGSGKTTVLVDRYLEILRDDNVNPEKIVAITFTDKAAAEMKRRIIDKLNETENTVIRENHIEKMNTAPISTIHAFCSRILREFPFEAGVPANFSIIQGIDQKLLVKKTIHDNLKDIATDPTHTHYEDLRLSLQRYGNSQSLVDLFFMMIGKRDVVAQVIENVYSDIKDGQIPDTWDKIYRADLPSESQITSFIESLKKVLEFARGKNVTEVTIIISKLDMLPDQNPNSPCVLELLKDVVDLITNKDGSIGKSNFLGRGVDTTDYESEINMVVSMSEKIKTARIQEADESESEDQYLVNTTHHIRTLYSRILDAYQSNKLSQGILDYDDLQMKTRDLIKNSKDIRRKLSDRYEYFMIDEYQDTNEIQYELVMLLTNELQDANLFIVGDPKQSIFGFRGADVRVFDKTKQKIIDKGGIDIQLTENFRSLRGPVGFVNHFFEKLMRDSTQNEFEVAFESLTKARGCTAEGAIEIILGQKDNEETNESVIIAQHINNMIENNEQIWVRSEGGDETPQPIKYGDIAILIRSRSHLPDIEHALLSADIPYLTTGGIGFYQRQEIYDIWNYLNFLNAPEVHHTSLVGILRGPAFGISDTELYEISRQGDAGFWKKTNNYSTPTVQLKKAIATIKDHTQFAHRMPINQLIQLIVNETGIVGTLKLGKQGQQRWANYQKLLDLARDFDGDENKQTLSDFIEFLEILINEEPCEGQAPIENTSGSVEIMTVHSAKGKQFPVVILPCLNRGGKPVSVPFIDEELGIGFNPLKPEDAYTKSEPEIVNLMKARASAKDEAEKKRLFYVAATRAKDRLILSGSLSNNKPYNLLKWLFEDMGINKDHDIHSAQVTFNTYINSETTEHSFDLHIPINKRIYTTDHADKLTDETRPIEFPSLPTEQLIPSTINASFSATELANYSRCPQRYQLEHILQIQPLVNGQSDINKKDLDTVIHNVLAQNIYSSSSQKIENLIDRAIRNYSEVMSESSTMRLKVESKSHIENFLNSELRRHLHNASEKNTNLHIYADINGHIITGKIDKLFKDQAGQLQGINYITFDAKDIDYYKPEMELLGLLIHKSCPKQPKISINYFLTKLSECLSMSFGNSDFQEITEQYMQNITSLQQESYKKKLTHCSTCPYADSQGLCIVN